MEHEAEEVPLSLGNPAHKVVAVAAGEAHTLALSGDGRVYSWGRGTFGRLGTGSESDELSPVPVKFDSVGDDHGTVPKFVDVAVGAYHSLALAEDGSVWCWGYNNYGQLGFDGENSSVPYHLDQLVGFGSTHSVVDESEVESNKPLKVSNVKAGGMMSLAIDNLGALWMWGNYPHQSSASDETVVSFGNMPTPAPVWDFHGHMVIKVACGSEHVVALVTSGETFKGDDLVCYSWGNNKHGQLGLGDMESRPRPQVIETFNQESPWTAYEVVCGAFHTAILTQKRRPSATLESRCWTFGLGENGQLGHGTTRSTVDPQYIEALPQHIYLVSADCGLFHTSVVSSAGDVWSWGMENGMGLCPDACFALKDSGDAASPLLISCNGSKFPEPMQVACGAAHTVLVIDGGFKLCSWGRGWSGVLGDGKKVDSYIPTMVLWPPLSEDFKEKGVPPPVAGEVKKTDEDLEGTTETEKKLSVAMEEMKLLQSRLSIMERYASIVHGSMFGKPLEERDIPISLQEAGSFDIAKEWEMMLDRADRSELVHLERFYGNMLAQVKDKLLKRRILEIVKDCLRSAAAGGNN